MPGSKAIRSKLGYGPHVMLLFILAFAAFILSQVPSHIPPSRSDSLSSSLLITFSAPFIRGIYFLRAQSTNFGAFGFVQPSSGITSPSELGYEFGTQVLAALTRSMILWGILDVFLFFQLVGVVPLLWVHDSAALHAVANSTFFTYSSASPPSSRPIKTAH